MKKKGYNITLGIFIGLIAGVIVGIIMPEWTNTALSVVASIYMSALKMMIFPLVFTSLVMGIIGIGDIAKTGKAVVPVYHNKACKPTLPVLAISLSLIHI